MSMFGFGGRGSNEPANAQKLAAAETELDMVTDMFNRLVESCHAKCIPPRYGEGELNKGESVCIDRCVLKYFEVNRIVGEHMQKMGGAAGAGAGTGGGGSAGGFAGLGM